MALILFLLALASAEWQVSLTLSHDNSSYHSIKPWNYYRNLDLSGFICSGDTVQEIAKCQSLPSPIIWVTHLPPSSRIEWKLQSAYLMGVSALVLVTNETDFVIESTYNNALDIFVTKDNSIWASLEEAGGFDQASFRSYFYFECEWVDLQVWFFGVFSVTWVGVIAWWSLNNMCCNHRDATVFHRLMTVLLILKAVNVLACFSMWASCPFTQVTVTLLSLLQNQTRTLFETCFFSMLLILCKGLGLTREDFSRAEFNYLAMTISLVYIVDSGYYILMGALESLIVIMFFGLFFHCLAYSYNTFATLRTQRLVAEAVGIESIKAACAEKRSMFRSLFSLTLCYFAFKAAAYLASVYGISRSDLSEYHKLAVRDGMHEFTELVVVFGIYFVYRARPRSEFFSIMLQHEDVEVPHVVPFYVAAKASEERRAGKYAVLFKPNSENSRSLSDISLGVSTRDEESNAPSEFGDQSQPLIVRSVELRSY